VNFEMAAVQRRERAVLDSQTDEVWVIEREAPAPRSDDLPGTGSMWATVQCLSAANPHPPQAHRRRASIAGYIATVDVTQQFHNPYDSKIEATYVFPLPTARPLPISS
jgi:Ca-activated chloride channel family protein